MRKAILFGAAGSGKRLFGVVSQKYEVIAYTDNAPEKWGGFCNNVRIISPQEIKNTNFDAVVITSLPGLESITAQLIDMGIDERMIDSSFVTAPLESRRIFLEKLSVFPFDPQAQVAEAGVFEGDFARWINRYFPDRTLHLFDTFEGFDARDIDKEGDYSRARTGDYNNTSEDVVMKKMSSPEQVIIHRGFFPETAAGVEGKFCFVNLDMDLY